MPDVEPFRHFDHCPRCGAPAGVEATRDRFRCGGCGFVLFFNAASAVAAFVAREDGRVLFITRAREPARGRLAVPGGFVDTGETAEAALRREIREEVGLELDQVEYLTSHANEYPYAGVLYSTLDLFFCAVPIDPALARALDGIDGVCWLDPETVDPADLAFDSMRDALTVYRARRR
jgi:ADP-ribose pyrophosphatase YjhB (NUDIX family)